MADSTKLMSDKDFKNRVVQWMTQTNGYYKDLKPEAKLIFDQLFDIIDEQKKLYADAMLVRLAANALLTDKKECDGCLAPLAIESERQRNGGKHDG